MLKSPILVGFASIIPGLGLWIVEKRRQAIISFLLVAACAIFFLYSPWPAATELGLFAGLMIWAASVQMATYEANILKKISKENYVRARDVSNVSAPPAHIKRGERSGYKWREMLSRQLNPDEHLETYISARQQSYFRTTAYSFYRVALLQDKIMLVILSIFNKPAVVRRIGFSEIDSVSYRKGLISDLLKIQVEGEKPIKLQVTRAERDKAMVIVEKLQDVN